MPPGGPPSARRAEGHGDGPERAVRCRNRIAARTASVPSGDRTAAVCHTGQAGPRGRPVAHRHADAVRPHRPRRGRAEPLRGLAGAAGQHPGRTRRTIRWRRPRARPRPRRRAVPAGAASHPSPSAWGVAPAVAIHGAELPAVAFFEVEAIVEIAALRVERWALGDQLRMVVGITASRRLLATTAGCWNSSRQTSEAYLCGGFDYSNLVRRRRANAAARSWSR